MSGSTTDTDRLARLRQDARYHRERRDLYRAKAYGPRPTRPERLRELERTYDRAAERLSAAETGREQPGDGRDRGPDDPA
jgi:hypothetical protein